MFSAVTSFFSNFFTRNVPPIDMAQVDFLIENANREEIARSSIPIEHHQVTEGCFYKTGIITAKRNTCVFIDDKYICDNDKISIEVKIGDEVNYLAYQVNSNHELKICKIMSLHNSSWDNDEDYNGSLLKVDEPIQGQIMDRTIVGKVMKREGRRIFVEPHNIKFNLDDVRSYFIPQVGDWVSMSSLVEISEDAADLNGEVLEIERVQPLRSKIHVGIVTHYNLESEVGNIDRKIIFTKMACENGYVPIVGDKVVTENIESDQGAFVWRSLTVVPLNQPRKTHIKMLKSEDTHQDELGNEEKFGLMITKNLKYDLKLNEERDIIITVKNTGDSSQTIIRCHFLSKKNESQLNLISPKINEQIVIQPGQEISYIFRCKAIFMGLSKERFLFIIKGVKVVRTFEISVRACHSIPDINNRNNNCKNVLARQDVYDFEAYIPGVRPCKPPAFIAVRTGIYKIPQKFWDLVLEALNNRKTLMERQIYIGEGISCLHQSLNIQNYKERFHSLLYLEEISQYILMQKYDIESAVLTHCGEYLSLSVPGLLEKRPSLIIGDRAIVSFKWDYSKGEMKYEGFIHKVRSSEVLLKFNPKFHSDYSGEDCVVNFKVSNSTIRRCHDAVNRAVSHLGQEFLFPTKVVQKSPQFYITDIEEKKLAESRLVNQKTKNSFILIEKEAIAPDDHSTVCITKSPPSKVSVLERLFAMKRDTVETLLTQEKDDVSKFIVTTVRSCKDENIIIKTENKNGDVYKDIIEDYEEVIKKRKLVWYNEKLNYYQRRAVINILKGLARPLPYVIFGPPGTGKTITLCEAALQILTLIPESRILIATPSNSSANLITERLLNSEILKPGDLIRLVAQHCLEEGTIPEKLLPYCATGELQEERSGSKMKMEKSGFKTNCTASVLGRHRITIGTCSTLGIIYNMGFSRGHFTHVLVDEAGQATEPEIMIPLTFIHSDTGQVILAGDPMQLGPFVQSDLANYYGLGESFLSRILHQFPYQRDPEGFDTGYDPRLVTKLLMNYRSLPEILEAPNSLFYDSELIPQISNIGSKEMELLYKLSPDLPERPGFPPAIVFHGVDGNNYQSPDSPSWYNPEEATQVYFYLLKLYNRGLVADNIGIITPYRSQVHQIRELLIESEMNIPKIGSVEEFQGQERDVIILSTVRSTSSLIVEDIKHALGFVSAPRRLNVALTRARTLLIIIGNPYLLYEDIYWRNILIYCEERNAYTGCSISLIEDHMMNFEKKRFESE